MINYSIDTLMSHLGCERFPERWQKIYDDAKTILENGENPLLRPEYYDELHGKYQVLGNTLEYYKKAAQMIAESEELSLFFCLLCRALRDRGTIQSDLSQMQLPIAPEGADILPYDMMTALSMCQAIPDLYEQMRARKVPDEILFESLRIPEKCVELHLKRSNRPRLTSFAWYQHAYNGKLFRIDRLQLEFPQGMEDIYRYFESNNGDIIAFPNNLCMHRDGFPLGSRNYEDDMGSFVATVEETDDAYIGYPYKINGHIALEKISLPKSEWHVKLKGGDKLVGLHIPPDEPFNDEIIEATLKKSREFLKTCYPDYDYKAFFCGSWLLDPTLIDILGENANISKFCQRFITVGVKNNGRDVFGYVFRAYEDDIDIPSLPENTRLQKALKQHFLNGNSIYVMHGVFFDNDNC